MLISTVSILDFFAIHKYKKACAKAGYKYSNIWKCYGDNSFRYLAFSSANNSLYVFPVMLCLAATAYV
jgi:hypothetical protein